MTEWRICPSFPQYAVSEHGEVMRRHGGKGTAPGLVLRGYILNTGYRMFDLHPGGGKRVRALAHRLVCETWHGPQPPDRPEVDHLDGDRLNNHHTNLRWVSRAANEANKIARGMGNAGARHGMAKLVEKDVRAIRNDSRSHRHIAAEYGIAPSTVSQIKGGARWAHI